MRKRAKEKVDTWDQDWVIVWRWKERSGELRQVNPREGNVWLGSRRTSEKKERRDLRK